MWDVLVHFSHRFESPATVNKSYRNRKEFSYFFSQKFISNLRSFAMCLKRDVIEFVDLDGNALRFVPLTRSVDYFSLRQRLENQIEVS